MATGADEPTSGSEVSTTTGRRPRAPVQGGRPGAGRIGPWIRVLGLPAVIVVLAMRVPWHGVPTVWDRTAVLSNWGIRAYLANERPEEEVVLLPTPKPYTAELACAGYQEFEVTSDLRAWLIVPAPTQLPERDRGPPYLRPIDGCAGHWRRGLPEWPPRAPLIGRERLIAVEPAILLSGGQVALFPTPTTEAARFKCAGYRESHLFNELTGWTIDPQRPLPASCPERAE